MVRLISASALVFLCTAAAGCGDDPGPTTPITPPTQINENFAGTLNLFGAVTHVFTTTQTGQASATISALVPDGAARVSFMFGTWNGQYCAVTFVKDDATTGSNFLGNATGPGAFCVRISDIGLLTAPTDYEIVVTHF
jgi:hypothetical protein